MNKAKKEAPQNYVEDLGWGNIRTRRARKSDGARKSDKKVVSKDAKKRLDSVAIKMRRKTVKALKYEGNKESKPTHPNVSIWDDQTSSNCHIIKTNPTNAVLPNDLYQNPFIDDRSPNKKKISISPRDKFLRNNANTLWRQDRTGRSLSVSDNLVSLAPASTSYNPSLPVLEKAFILQKEIQKKDKLKKKKEKERESNLLRSLAKTRSINYETIKSNNKTQGEDLEDKKTKKVEDIKEDKIIQRVKPSKLTEKQRKQLKAEKLALKGKIGKTNENTDRHVKYAIANIQDETSLIKRERRKKRNIETKIKNLDSQMRRLNKVNPQYVGKKGEKSGISGMRGVVRTSSLFRDIMFGLKRTGVYLQKKPQGQKNKKLKRNPKGSYRLVKVKRKGIW